MRSDDLVTPDPRPRCHFGRPHTWSIGFYHAGEWIDDHAWCATCGQIEAN